MWRQSVVARECCGERVDRKKPPPPGGSIYYVPSSRTVCKRTPFEAPGYKLFEGGPLTHGS